MKREDPASSGAEPIGSQSSSGRDTPPKSTPKHIDYRKYEVTSKGVNAKGNRYDNRVYTTPDGSSKPLTGYHYSNKDGSYYYKNPDGSNYYNNGEGGARYTREDGSGWVKRQFDAPNKPSTAKIPADERPLHTPSSTPTLARRGSPDRLDGLADQVERMTVADRAYGGCSPHREVSDNRTGDVHGENARTVERFTCGYNEAVYRTEPYDRGVDYGGGAGSDGGSDFDGGYDEDGYGDVYYDDD